MRNVTTTLLVLIAVLLSPPARAATVTTAADSGSGSLREAIASAAPGDTINFSSGPTITLTSGELLIDKNLIISGPGASNLLIQRSTDTGTPDFRIFNVLSGNVIISGLTVSNGRDDIGGGIYSKGNLTLNDCAVTGNFASESGGGIFNQSSMTINNCVVSGNSAAGATWDGFGGGIYNGGTVTTFTSTFSNNSVSGKGDGFGGGIYNGGTLTNTSSVINSNSATGGPDNGGGFGGGINNWGGTSHLDRSTVSGNVARGGAGSDGGLGEGGGVASDGGTVTLDRSTVSANSAVGGDGDGGSGGSAQGGGVAQGVGTVYLFNSTVSGNVSSGGSGTNGLASSYGGGIYNDIGTVEVTHSTITANVVPGDGGGIFNLEGWVGLKSTIVAANTATVDLFNVEVGNILLDGIILSDGFNLVGSTNGFIFTGPGDQFNITASALKLGPLQNNGGPTFTHALLCGSAAINAGNNTDAPVTDQRGFARIVGGVIDIGAYEGGNTAPSISCPSPTTLDYVPPAGAVATVSVNVADADGDPLVVVWTVDGTAYQTNAVAAGGPPTAASVTFTAAFGEGSHSILVRVTDSEQCEATCATTVLVTLPPEAPPQAPTLLGCISVLQLGAANVSITGPAGGILGDVAIAPNGNMSMTGDQYVSGTIMLGSGARFSNSSHGTVQVAQNVDLSGEINAAYAMAASAASLPCTQSFAKLDGKTVTTVVGGPGVNVICVGDIVLSGKQITLLAPAGASFIFNVRGKFVFTGGGQGPQIRVAGGVQPEDVLYNVIGTGSDVSFSGGGGGVNCCAAIVDGTLLAPQRKIKLSPGLVNGAVISARDISIVSGSSVRCPASP